MDLKAYMDIPKLEQLAADNGISVPRLRGYALVSAERAVTRQEIDEAVLHRCGYVCERACCSVPRFRPESCISEFSQRTDTLKKKYLITETEAIKDADGTYEFVHPVGIRWDLIHGKNRKALKLALKHTKRDVEEYFRVHNKYAGRPDVLRVRARIGGDNWLDYFRLVVDKPWFLEKVDDYWDDTYCDIFCKIEMRRHET